MKLQASTMRAPLPGCRAWASALPLIVASTQASGFTPDVIECVAVGHPMDNSTFPADRLTAEFADFLNSSPLANGSGIRVALAANDRATSVRKHSFPASITTAIWAMIQRTREQTANK